MSLSIYVSLYISLLIALLIALNSSPPGNGNSSKRLYIYVSLYMSLLIALLIALNSSPPWLLGVGIFAHFNITRVGPPPTSSAPANLRSSVSSKSADLSNGGALLKVPKC